MGVGCHTPGDLPDSGIEPASPGSPALASRSCTTEPPGKQILMRLLHRYTQLYTHLSVCTELESERTKKST